MDTKDSTCINMTAALPNEETIIHVIETGRDMMYELFAKTKDNSDFNRRRNHAIEAIIEMIATVVLELAEVHKFTERKEELTDTLGEFSLENEPYDEVLDTIISLLVKYRDADFSKS